MKEKAPEPVARSRGRPRGAESGERVSTWLPASQYDRLIREANQRKMSVSEYVRRVVIITLR